MDLKNSNPGELIEIRAFIIKGWRLLAPPGVENFKMLYIFNQWIDLKNSNAFEFIGTRVFIIMGWIHTSASWLWKFWISLYFKPMNGFEKFQCIWVHRNKSLHYKWLLIILAPPSGENFWIALNLKLLDSFEKLVWIQPIIMKTLVPINSPPLATRAFTIIGC